MLLMMAAPISACLSCPSLGWTPSVRIHELPGYVQGPQDLLGVLSTVLLFASLFPFFTITPSLFLTCCLPCHLLSLVSLESNFLLRRWSGRGTEGADGCSQCMRLAQAAANTSGRENSDHELSVVPRAARLGASAGPTSLLTPLLSLMKRKEERKAIFSEAVPHHDNAL